ncbi:alkaline phosphatase family protein [Flavihumibacter sp. UBA7668]|uniref:alkaline phosphatase family protein n=1 Tax=Flavihumibacter sp. UBA7668 TaxID=1946542 RepID=UPI0025C6C18E|nr:alkaline phosphatase family protein [Flavihumibacter sp. UBA7668]
MFRKSIQLPVYVFLFLFGFSSAFSQKKNKRIVVIGLDGYSVPGYQKARHPNLDTLFSSGILSLTTRPVMPSVTMPNWTSHLTGAGPEEHGVTSNEWNLNKHTLKAIETDADGYFPSIFKVVKDQVPGVQTAFYYNWANLIKPFNQKYLDDVFFEQNDGYDSSYQRAIDFIQTKQNNPQLIFLYSVHTDHAGHNHKWMSPEYIQALEEADAALGRFVSGLKKIGLLEDTYFLFITDHGGHPANGHGGLSMDEMLVPWALTGPKIKHISSSIFYNSNKNTAVVLAKLFGIKKLPESWTGKIPWKK